MGSILNLLRDPFWQGVGVIFAIVFGFLGFYYNGKNKLWLYVAGFVLTFILGLTAGTAIQAATPQIVVNNPVPIAIDAKKDWQSTGLNLKKGDSVEVRVEGGKWSTSTYNKIPDALLSEYNKISKSFGYPESEGFRLYFYRETDGNGDKLKDCSDCPILTSGSNFGSLIARIGESRPFGIGNEKAFIAKDEGHLQLRINDSIGNEDYLNDNSGLLAVTIKK